MPLLKLDSTTVLTATCPPGKSKETLFDSTLTGFTVEIRSTGGTYALRYKDEYGRQRQYRIGKVGEIPFKEAKRQAAQIKARVTVGKNPVEERKLNRSIPTLAELADRYLAYVRTSKKSHDIDERYLRLHLLPKFGKLHLDQLRQEEIVEWLNGKVAEGYAQATVNRWQVILSYMLRLAKLWKVPGAETNVLEGVKQKDPDNRKERYLSPAETQRLKRAVDDSPNPMLKYIVALLLLTGARKREVLDAEWRHVDLDRKTWFVPVTKTKPRHIPLSDEAIAVLRAIPRFANCPYVLPNPKTKRPFRSFYNSWDTARRAAYLPDVRVHDLRHSHASNLVNAGQSLYVVSRVLGHSNTRTSERYAHLNSSVLLDAVNAASKQTETSWT
jgi:integrase